MILRSASFANSVFLRIAAVLRAISSSCPCEMSPFSFCVVRMLSTILKKRRRRLTHVIYFTAFGAVVTAAGAAAATVESFTFIEATSGTVFPVVLSVIVMPATSLTLA